MKANALAYCASFIALAFGSCTQTSKNESASDMPRSVPVAHVTVLDTTIYNEYVADIQAVKNVEVRARLSGFLEKIYVEEGSEVKAGQVLFKINDEEYKADLSKAEAVLNNAIADAKTVELEKQRTQTLVKNNIVSKTDLELAGAKLKAAQSRVAEARSVLQFAKSRLGYTLVRAPFSGRIDRIPLKAGSLLEEGSLLTSVSDLSAVNVYFSISEKEYLGIAADSGYKRNGFKKTVKLSLANGQVYPYPGEAAFAESEFASQTGTISLKARFENPNRLLKHGASGKISVPVETGEILAVHQKSVFEIQDRTYVYMVDSKNRVKMTPFSAGQRVGHYYTVNSGLAKGDKIVFEGTQSLRDGIQIDPKAMDAKPGAHLAKN
ncbi:membrane fusion protein (multidrug efflux system) [Arcticibacter pallidicorallinus]|uniref:Membrane fusion protein (Multidrug efflux system) n=1 Tax=Arcticibacter pallidicorallinus TaxID=1259464 RepID=A0A2T0U4H3_9SPHI|nr:efflux RND transporter periplasmic adaptor subunit [Arcticibacter pallidicorallinus]PRY52821.1 membrane fusion protein (multidrug efflux system) [Arcticibacter pallidicorallinus]